MPDIPNQPYEVAIERDRMVALRDGVRLATDVHRPARDGRAVEDRFPVILERTPYGKSAVTRSESRAEIAARFEAAGFRCNVTPCWAGTPLPNVLLVGERQG